ncbi:YbhB/YbcL family Raf kinase inhibitor-like protein [Pseudovibrio sp. WM33]|uniref:YbhB/YbcL family Raf kinase inhibitor-like protein n=1 Tax=Pseudovibrio sp. WM33 TaxID=1735585 RepID=UPI0007AE94A8|nr:YbhB/YbcL family Raf kinase inhibitor-like protein [Pseudovibrio sp. WM33]KZL23730.1 putative kinase inhibitor [Pseudovibrio sp. WM33]
MLPKPLTLGLAIAASLASAAHAQGFKLTSTSIAEGAQLTNEFVYNGFGCTGGNLSPQLSWSNAPEGTKSFALTAYDPDAPTGSGWWHWNVVNIPASANSLEEGASNDKTLPSGSMEITNDYGSKGFGGACPPQGEVHRYIFTIHALGVPVLDLPENPSNALVGYMIGVNRLQSAKITAVFNH